MQEHDARILRGAAIPTGVCGLLAIGGSALVAGGTGALSAAFAAGIILACFGLGQLLVLMVARKNPDFFLPAAMLGFVVKVVALGILLVTMGDSELAAGLHRNAFAITALLCVVVWLGAHMRGAAKAGIPHVDPADAPENREQAS